MRLKMDRAITVRVFLEIPLVIFFRGIKFTGGFHLGDYLIPEDLGLRQELDGSFGGLFLSGVMIKNGRAVLRADVVLLTVHGCRVMVTKKDLKKLPVAYL